MSDDQKPAQRPGLVHEFHGAHMLLMGESALLLVLSLADLFMTYTLLQLGVGHYEANPIANWWFDRWNIAGMTIFKFAVVGLVIVCSEVVERRRPGRGRAILWFGSLVTALVLAHGLRLLLRAVGVSG